MDADSRFEQLYKHLLRQTSTPVIVHDAKGRIVNFNRAARMLLGQEREVLRTMTLLQLTSESRRDHMLNMLRQVGRERSIHFEAPLKHADGSERTVTFVSQAVDFDGRALLQSVLETTPEPEEVSRSDQNTDRLIELNMVFSLSPNGLALLDHDQKVQVANPAFARFLERTLGQVIGMHIADIETDLNSRVEEGQPPLQLSDWEEPSPDETLTSPPHRRVRLATPKQRTVKCQFRRLGLGSSSAILSLQDITREDEIDRLKTRFLSAAAHELRNPMASISGFADLLTSTPQDSEVFGEIVSTIQTQARSMSSLVDELLELTRMGALGARDLEIRRIDTEEWVRTTARQFRRPDDERVPAVHCEEPVPSVSGDVEKLTRALTNVLSNAFKYSNSNAPVDVHLSADKDGVHIGVQDHGIGMTPEDVARICDPFYRASAAKSVQGTGLGMALVLEIMNSHDGSLDVQSKPGHGTRITLSLPL